MDNKKRRKIINRSKSPMNECEIIFPLAVMSKDERSAFVKGVRYAENFIKFLKSRIIRKKFFTINFNDCIIDLSKSERE